MPNLEYEFSYQAVLKEPLDFAPAATGHRVFVEVTSGTVEGKRLKGKILTGGGDWLFIGPDGFGRLDVRAQIVTDDGAAIYLQYLGVLEMNAKIQAALGGQAGTDFGDQYFRTNPRFETGNAKYAWLTQNLFVGEGRILAGRTVEYKVYRVT